MSNANSVVHPASSTLLTLKGYVSVHFLDGQNLDGEIITQDPFNIFLKVDHEPVMIPRIQIRFIKGQTVEQIEEDDSQPRFAKGEAASDLEALEMARPERFDTEEYSLSAVDQRLAREDDIEDEMEDEDETEVLEPGSHISQTAGPEATGEEMEEEEEYDSTMVIDLNKVGLGEVDDDDGTVVLPPGSDKFAWAEEDDDGTLILESPPKQFEDDPDATVVRADISDAEEDVTLLIPEPTELEITATLTCTTGPHAGDVFTLQSGINTLGRSNDNLLVLSKDKEISRRHAIILLESGRFVIQDQNSLNGTFVNDEQVTGPRYLEDGDEILVGLSTLKYTID